MGEKSRRSPHLDPGGHDEVACFVCLSNDINSCRRVTINLINFLLNLCPLVDRGAIDSQINSMITV